MEVVEVSGDKQTKLLYGLLFVLTLLSLISMLNQLALLSIVTVIFAIAVTIKFWRHPAYLAFVVALPFGVKLAGYNEFPLTDIYILIGLVNLKNLWKEAKRSSVFKLQGIYTMTLAALLVVSALFGLFTLTGFVSFGRELGYVFFFLIGTVVLSRQEDVKKFLFSLVTFGTINGLIALVYMIVTNNLGTGDRGAARILNISWPNYYGIFLTVVLLLAVTFQYLETSKREKIFMGVAIVLLGVIILYSYSRAAYVMAQVSLSAFVLVAEKKWLKKIGLVFLIILFFSFTPQAHQRISSTIEQGATMGVDNATYSRLARITATLDFFNEHWTIAVVGSGFRSAEYVIPTVYNANLKQDIPMGSAHNDYLDRIARIGIVGFLIWSWFFLTLCWKLVQKIIDKTDKGIKNLSTGIVIAFLSLAVVGMTEVLFKNPHIVTLIWILVGLSSSVVLGTKSADKSPSTVS